LADVDPLDVRAVVVNWRQPDLTSLAVDSLLAQRGLDGVRFGVTVVDNASGDGSAERLRERHPEVEVLESPINGGFGAGVGLAVRHRRADVFVLLNSDAVAEPGFVAALLAELQGGDRVGAVTGRITLSEPVDGRTVLNSTGNEMTRSGNGRDRDWLVPVEDDRRPAGEVAGFSGGAVALSAAALDEVGLFDESLFMYYEDTDLSWRMRRAGWSIRYAPDARVAHRHATSWGTASAAFRFHNERNRLLVAAKVAPLDVVARAYARTLLRRRLRPLAAALRALPRSLRARRAIDRSARVPRRAVAAWLVDDGAPSPIASAVLPRVLLDATSLPPDRGGVARYIEGLIVGLDALGHPIDVVCKPADVDRLRSLGASHRYTASPRAVGRRPVRFAWEQLGLPRLARRLGVEVVHSPHYTFPLLTRMRSVVTLHDATFFSDPEAHSGLKRRFFSWWIRRASRRASALVTPSQATAQEVERAVGLRSDRVTVAYLGVDAEVFHPPSGSEIAAFANEHAAGGAWIAFLGTIEPRKNVGALLEAYLTVRAERGDETPSLVLSGARGWDADALARLDALSAADGVIEAGYLPTESLRSLLGGAAVVAYPSIGEGFGLPVLEAMACGAAVLTTPRLSIPEVGGDAVVYVEPDAPSIAQGLRDLLDDDTARDRLGALAIDRAAGFTWQACARAHLGAYASAGGVR
jgi:GT2 family glycosyltransferase/glycosyltransferase involved in cell wall biosynthesis